ncbi:MAG: beta-propeller domain-containing protein [Phycisphaerae bacterium]|jgi:uncharacterized secreted protein with C-terminal beta-propeller domain
MNRNLGISPRFSLVLAAGLLVLAGCPQLDNGNGNGTGDGGDATARPRLVPFDSPDQLISYFRDQARAAHGGSFFDRFFGGMNGSAGGIDMAVGAAEDSSADGGQTATPYSATNIQEAGVDEADIVKTDGQYIYIARGSSLRIVQAVPTTELAQAGQLDLDSAFINELYLNGDTALLLASNFQYAEGGGMAYEIWPPYYVNQSFVVYQVDVSNPAAPAIVKRMELDGTLVSSRLTQDRLILVMTIAPELPTDPTPLSLATVSLDDVLPRARGMEGDTTVVSWDRCLHPATPDGYYMTAVVTLDASDVESIVGSTAIMASASTIYATADSLYLTDAAWSMDGEAREKTAIHKFSFNTETGAEYVASGEVPGRLLNQFSLSDSAGYLRVATHISPAFWFGWDMPVDMGMGVGMGMSGGATGSAGAAVSPDEPAPSEGTGQDRDPSEPVNAVYVLGVTEADGERELSIVGRIEDIAPGEQIYSARFIGDHGFLVTFEQVDPLFVLDFTDPQNPALVGQLKVPGYSDYLHPLGDHHLIGVGRSVTQSDFGGVIRDALQLSLFDVSDWSNPTLVQQLEVGGPGSYSDVSYTHKAFAFLEDSGMLALPAWLNNNDSFHDIQYDAFSGVVCFQVDPATGFTELGRVESVTPALDFFFGGVWGTRAVLIGDTVYAVNSLGVRAAPVSDFTQIATAELPE